MSPEPYEPRITPWQIDESDFYELTSQREQVEFLLQYAVLAPSSHNRQPWLFKIVENGVEVYADYSRSLALTDPDDRELLISVGAMITNLRAAAAWFGFETTVMYERRLELSAPVASIAIRETSATDDKLRSLFPAIRKRHTNRKPFSDEPVDSEAVSAVCDLLEQYPATLRLIPWHDRKLVVDLVREGDLRMMRRPAVRAELADWIAPSNGERADGIPADSLGMPGPFAAINWVIRNIDLGTLQAQRDRALADKAAAIIVVTAADDRVSLIQAGEVLERVLLTATQYGMLCTFMNQPIQVPELRRTVQKLIGTGVPPQLLLLVGRGAEATKPAPRRALASVIVE